MTAAWAPDARVLGLALVVDLALGDPRNAFHPVAWLGRAAAALVARAPQRGPARQLAAGALLVAALVLGAGAAAALFAAAAGALPPVLGVVACALALKSTFAIRGLGQAGRQVADRLRAGDLDGARFALRSLCSRDAAPLTGAEVAAATVESLAENSSDSVVAPLVFYALFGLPGAACYRAANTLDAMIGYHGRFEYLGKVAARLDDVLNWLPARLTARLLLVAGAFRGADVARGRRVLARDGAATESPNAGRPMAAMAGLLGVALEKRGCYRLGDALAPVGAGDIVVAWRLARDAGLLAAGLALVAIAVRAGAGW
jgi:adenosylcobinamide-phosphate synthase